MPDTRLALKSCWSRGSSWESADFSKCTNGQQGNLMGRQAIVPRDLSTFEWLPLLRLVGRSSRFRSSEAKLGKAEFGSADKSCKRSESLLPTHPNGRLTTISGSSENGRQSEALRQICMACNRTRAKFCNALSHLRSLGARVGDIEFSRFVRMCKQCMWRWTN